MDENFKNKRYIIKKFRILIRWLRTNINDEDLINKLYYLIFVSKYIKLFADQKRKLDYYLRIDLIFYQNKSFDVIQRLGEYNKNTDYFIKLKENINQFIELEDLDISFLPEFVNYDHYLDILVWIIFCHVNSKKSERKNSFLYDIYLFQKEQNKRFKIEFLIIVLEKMMNYIQYYNYKKKIYDK